MSSVVRLTSVVGVFTLFAGKLIAAPLSATILDPLDWSQQSAIPSGTTSSDVMYDAHVQTLSQSLIDASVTDLSSAGECTQCDFASPVVSPTWSISAGAIFLHRGRPEPAAIVTPPTGTPGVVINGTDFDFDWGSGVDLALMHRGPRGYIWEGRYFDSDDADAAYTIPSITTFRVAGIGVTILGGGSINGTYTTKLDSSELNIHKQITDRVTFLSGFRWIELHDTMRLDIATPATFVRWDENNHMYGGQVGTNLAFTDPANPFRLNMALKAGAYSNEACNRFTSTIVGGDHEEDSDIAFVGEANLSANYYITQHIALRGGYQLMWLDNVALASDAATATAQVPGGTSSPVITDGRLFYNGATAAVEFVW